MLYRPCAKYFQFSCYSIASFLLVNQRKSIPWQTMKGIIYFEKKRDVYSMYFIETVHSDLSSLIKGKDSVDVFL